MRRTFWLRCVSTLLLGLSACFAAHAQTLFFEDFQTAIDPISGQPQLRCSGPGGPGTYPFAPGWLLRNVDNRTPDPQVAYVNEAWEVREDFGNDVNNCVAFSNSFYAPVGAANDWMWTPPIGPLPAGTTQLSWRARSYDPAFLDAYEVRVMVSPNVPSGGTGVIGNQITASSVLFSTAGEAPTWTAHAVDLSPFAGQSIHIGFRNNSNDKFLLVVDDVRVENITAFDPDLVAVGETAAGPYAKVPAPLGYGFDLDARVRNGGTSPLTGVTVEADLLVDGAPVQSLASPPIASLAPGLQQSVILGTSTYDQVGTWTVEALIDAVEGDENPGNSALLRPLTQVTADELTRAQGAAIGAIGIGAGNGGEIGSDFELPSPARLHGARATINNNDVPPDETTPGDGVGDFNGYTLSMVLRAWDEATDKPGALLMTASTTVPEDAPIAPLTLEFDFGVTLPPGRYLLAMVEPTQPEPITLSLANMLERFTPGTVWVNWPTNPFGGWANIEQFGASFERTPDITAILRAPVPLPAAQDDSFVVPESGVFAGDVSLNDTPSDEGGSEWSIATPPATGMLSMQLDGTFEYTPAAGAGGSTVVFGYTLCDADDDCSPATVELDIQVNTPVAADDVFGIESDEPFSGDVALNDTLSDDGGNVWAATIPPAAGVLVMQPSGAFTYTPVAAIAGTTVTFSYSLCDDDADCSTATVQLNAGVNNPAAQDDSFTVSPGGVFIGDVASNDTPSADGGNVWSVVTPPVAGALVMQPTGSFAYTPDAGAGNGPFTFEYSVCDAETDCDTAQVELSLLPLSIFADSFESPP